MLDELGDPVTRVLAPTLTAAERGPGTRLLFLDPDTGIEPGALQPEHASSSEIARLWKALEHGAHVHSILGNVAADVAILWARRE